MHLISRLMIDAARVIRLERFRRVYHVYRLARLFTAPAAIVCTALAVFELTMVTVVMYHLRIGTLETRSCVSVWMYNPMGKLRAKLSLRLPKETDHEQIHNNLA